MSDLGIGIHARSGTCQVQVHLYDLLTLVLIPSKMSFLPSRADPLQYPCRPGPKLLLHTWEGGQLTKTRYILVLV